MKKGIESQFRVLKDASWGIENDFFSFQRSEEANKALALPCYDSIQSEYARIDSNGLPSDSAAFSKHRTCPWLSHHRIKTNPIQDEIEALVFIHLIDPKKKMHYEQHKWGERRFPLQSSCCVIYDYTHLMIHFLLLNPLHFFPRAAKTPKSWCSMMIASADGGKHPEEKIVWCCLTQKNPSRARRRKQSRASSEMCVQDEALEALNYVNWINYTMGRFSRMLLASPFNIALNLSLMYERRGICGRRRELCFNINFYFCSTVGAP